MDASDKALLAAILGDSLREVSYVAYRWGDEHWWAWLEEVWLRFDHIALRIDTGSDLDGDAIHIRLLTGDVEERAYPRWDLQTSVEDGEESTHRFYAFVETEELGDDALWHRVLGQSVTAVETWCPSDDPNWDTPEMVTFGRYAALRLSFGEEHIVIGNATWAEPPANSWEELFVSDELPRKGRAESLFPLWCMALS